MTAAPPAQTRTKTSYHIFREIDQAGAKAYEPVEANVQAASADAALTAWAKNAHKTADATTGVYVAVAARRFTPKTITFSTTTVIKVG